MTRFLYALNIGTLATWLSVAGFGGVGVAIHGGRSVLPDETNRELFSELESIEISEDFDVGDPPNAQATEAGSAGEASTIEEILPQPPEMPEFAGVTPLPEIPNLPAPTPAATSSEAAVTTPSPPVSKPKPKVTTRSKPPTGSTGGSPAGQAATPGKTGTGQFDASRLAGGRTPAPSYPAEARSRGQTGTVLVEFVVGADGRVVSAYARRPSPWPLLNERAVSAVLRWKFRPGSVAKFTKPIVFKLN